ncbi:hypothetical protein H1C71_024010 [Ictidomys tridecemlineatus]|nr:hypothetical protein H1C71_024010 [Ictidomys tridecemlineatus]
MRALGFVLSQLRGESGQRDQTKVGSDFLHLVCCFPGTCQRLCAFRWSRAPPEGQHYILKDFLGPKSVTQALPRCGKSAPLEKASAATSHPVMPGCEPYIKVSWA